MKMNKASKFIAVLLAFTLCLNLITPVYSKAEGFPETNNNPSLVENMKDEDVPDDTSVYHDTLTREEIESLNGIYSKEDKVLEANDDTILSEVKNRMEIYAKHFRLSNGSYIAASYDYEVYEPDERTADLIEIDNRLTEQTEKDGRKVYAVSGETKQVSFNQILQSGNTYSYKRRNGSFSWGLISNSLEETPASGTYYEPLAEENKTKLLPASYSGLLLYDNILENTNLCYRLLGNTIKENILLTDAGAILPLKESGGYEFLLSTKNIKAELKDNTICLYTRTGEDFGVISAPYMEDANGAYSKEITLSLKETEEGYIVKMSPDTEWLSDSSRVFPIAIDPTFQALYIGNVLMTGTSVNSARPNSAEMFGYGEYYVGREASSYGNVRGAFKVNTLPAITGSDMIIDAVIRLNVKHYYGSGSITVNFHELNQSVSISALTWNGLSGRYNGTIIDSQEVSAANVGGYIYADLTKAARQWYLNGNFGVAMTSENENGTYKYVMLSSQTNSTSPNSTTAPRFIFTYINQEGLEDYLTYHSGGSASMGTLSVGDFNGNLIYTYTDISQTGNALPVTIQHIYSHGQRTNADWATGLNTGYSSAKFGAGFRLNIYQRIDDVNFAGYRYKYTDGDGTEHYFRLKSGTEGAAGSVYEKENDTNTILTKTASGYTLTAGGTVEYDFNATGFLSVIRDISNGKTQTLTYNGNQVIRVTDGNGRHTSLSYGADGYLSSITDPAGRTTTFSYAIGLLLEIHRPDGTVIHFDYANVAAGWVLVNVVDIDGSFLQMAYSSMLPYRVVDMVERSSDGIQGQHLYWDYTSGETTVSDRAERSETMLFDYSGHTVVVRDNEGNAVYGGYGDDGSDNGDNNTKHSLLYQSKMQGTVRNYLKNSGFEDGTFSPWIVNCVENAGDFYIDSDENGNHGIFLFSFENYSDYDYADCTQTVTVPGVRGKEVTFSVLAKTYPIGDEKYSLSIGYLDNTGNTVFTTREFTDLSSFAERRSVSVIIPENACNDNVIVKIGARTAYNGILFDNAQLEVSSTASRYNMLTNGHFGDSVNTAAPASWTTSSCTSADKVVSNGRDVNGFLINGDSHTAKSISQIVTVPNGSAGDNYVFSAWAKADSLSKMNRTTETERNFAIRMRFKENGSMVQEELFDFEAKTSGWQFLSGSIVAEESYDSVELSLVYEYQKNTVIFDDAALYRERFGDRMEYDDEGRMIKSVNPLGQETTYTYLASGRSELSRVDYYDGSFDTYTYDPTTRRLLSTTDSTGITTDYSYDSNGNLTGTEATVGSGASALSVNSGMTTYSGSYVSSVTDTFGNTTSYNYNQSKGTLLSATNAKNVTTGYTYHSQNDYLTSVSSSGSTVNYTYQGGKLSTVSHNTSSLNADDVNYSFSYDTFGNRTSSKVGNRTLATYEYNEETGEMTKMIYGNGDYVENYYDSLGRETEKRYNGSESVRYVYGTDGKVGIVEDGVCGITTYYEYDSGGRLLSVYNSENEKFAYKYDVYGNPVKEVVHQNGQWTSTEYTYTNLSNGGEGNRVVNGVYFDDVSNEDSYRIVSEYGIRYSFDEFHRKESVCFYDDDGGMLGTTNYTYRDGASSGVTSSLVERIETDIESGYEDHQESYDFAYTYDSLGNIETESRDGSLAVRHYYDELNQLVRDDDVLRNKTIEYVYDKGGNILAVNEYPYTTGSLANLTPSVTHTYGYSDFDWKDKLTSFDGETITYDEIGNPLSYYNGSEFTWKNGRRLSEIETADGDEIEYRYNGDGIRTEKTVNGVTTFFTVQDGKIYSETTNGVTTVYLYDETGSPVGFRTSGDFYNTFYIYIKNLQGDIVGIVDRFGSVIAEIRYDSWGAPELTMVDCYQENAVRSSHFGYRGYYYDTETGLYYASSRYYDPEIGRFISPDTTDVLTAAPGALTDKNLYAYCDNNPVMRVDNGGDFWNWVIGAAVGAVVGVIGQVVSDVVTSVANGELTLSNWQTYTGAFIGGAVGGAILGGTGNVALANAASGFVTTGVGLALEKVTGESDKSWGEIAVNSVADGAISYGLGKLPGIKGITKGRNSMSAVYKSGLTKLRNGTAKTMSLKVLGKGVVSGFVGGLAMDGYYGVKQHGYDRFKALLVR